MLALLIFVVTLIFVIWQPKGLGIGWIAMGGAGFFHWAALHVVRWGKGRGRVLFPLIVMLGAVIAAVFANDGAALLLTPIVIASLPLVISNLVNIVSAYFFGIPFDRYAAVMVPIDLVALDATLTVLWLWYRRQVPTVYPVEELPAPATAIRDRAVFRAAFPLLALVLTWYFLTAPLHIPVCTVAGLAAGTLLIVAGRGQVIPVRRVLRDAPWQIVIFSLGMYLVVYGLRNAGLTAYLAAALVWLGHQGAFAATIGTGFLSELLSSVMNNMPSVLVGALAIQQTLHITPLTRDLMVYANVIGCDLGPKFTPIGSLATLL